MDPVAGGVMDVVGQTLEIKEADRAQKVQVSLLKDALEMDKWMGQEVARILQTGTKIDVSV